MSAGPVKSLAAGFSALGLMTLGPLTGNAIAQEFQPPLVNASSRTTTELPALVKAGRFGMKQDQVGIMMYYGSGNGDPADAIGDYVASELEARAKDRGDFLQADYFVEYVQDMEGIVLAYHIGGREIPGQDIRTAITEEAFDAAIDLRSVANKGLQLAELDY
tara:strand:+ start:179 stop:664 length:486 start_codon:yes stop_codon:yes gene_type:complete